MSRTALPLVAQDLSAFARSLARELDAHEGRPGHVQLLNMLARSAGYRNYQHFRADREAQGRLEQVPPAAAPPLDHLRVERAARYFDAEGRLVRWPSKVSHRQPCLWVLWSRMPAGRVHTEAEVNALLDANHLFGDSALLRRCLVDDGMVSRTRDCREYRRVERRPPPEAAALIRRLGRPVPERR